MSSKRTLQTLMDNLIKESLAPFSAEEFLKKVQEVLRKNLPADTLDNLKRNLSSHDYLIGLDSDMPSLPPATEETTRQSRWSPAGVSRAASARARATSCALSTARVCRLSFHNSTDLCPRFPPNSMHDRQ